MPALPNPIAPLELDEDDTEPSIFDIKASPGRVKSSSSPLPPLLPLADPPSLLVPTLFLPLAALTLMPKGKALALRLTSLSPTLMTPLLLLLKRPGLVLRTPTSPRMFNRRIIALLEERSR